MSKKTELPATLRHSDKRAQHIWQETHDNAVKVYGKGASPHRVAYAALKHEYKKKGDKWVKK